MRKTLLLFFGILSLSASAQTYIPAKAFLSTTASRTDIAPGECAVVTFAFTVYDANKAPIRFNKLGEQIGPILNFFSRASDTFVNGNIVDIKGKRVVIKGDTATQYDIIRGAYCPVATGDITIPSFSLKMRHIAVPRTDSMLVVHKSEPVTIHVSGVQIKPAENNQPPAVGHFQLSRVLRTKETGMGEPFVYQLLIDGNGSSGMLFPSTINREKFDVDFLGFDGNDIIGDDSVIASRTIKFQLIAKKGTEGVHKMSDIFGPIKYYDIRTKSMTEMKVGGSVTITDKPSTTKLNKLASDSTKTILFVVDVSQSMAVEDFKPYRLGYVALQLQKLVNKGYKIEPIVFSNYAKAIQTRKEWAEASEIDFNMTDKQGTAIGDAVEFAVRYAKSSGRNYSNNIVLIGDGDNTAGYTQVAMAANLAKANGFSIYPVGVGTFGKAPYGKNPNGSICYIEDTFQEGDFKTLATKTGGRYTRMVATSNLELVLKDVLVK